MVGGLSVVRFSVTRSPQLNNSFFKGPTWVQFPQRDFIYSESAKNDPSPPPNAELVSILQLGNVMKATIPYYKLSRWRSFGIRYIEGGGDPSRLLEADDQSIESGLPQYLRINHIHSTTYQSEWNKYAFKFWHILIWTSNQAGPGQIYSSNCRVEEDRGNIIILTNQSYDS